MASTGISVGILIFILIVVIVYVIVMYELYKNKLFIFASYIPSSPPNSFYPLGKVTPLSQEEIDHRNAVIRLSTGTAP